MLVLAERTYFCRNIDISAEMKLFLHFCRYSFLQNKLSLPNMQKIIWPKYSAETLFGRTLKYFLQIVQNRHHDLLVPYRFTSKSLFPRTRLTALGEKSQQ